MEYLFTHTDLDGAGCRVVFDLCHAYSDNLYKIFNCQNGSIDQDLENVMDEFTHHDRIVFADICPSNEMLLRLKNRVNHMVDVSVEIYDHHKTNLYALEVFPNAVIIPTGGDSWESGTSLLFKHINEHEHTMMNYYVVEKFVDTVRSYDTYEFKQTGNVLAKRLQTLFFLMGMDRFCDYYKTYLHRATSIIPPEFDMFIDCKLEQEQEIIDKFIQENKVRMMTVNGYKVAFVIGGNGSNISEMANQYLSYFRNVDAMCFYLPTNNILSFRTVRNDLDVGEVFAKPLGGGGHPKAAGAPLSEGFINKMYDSFWHYLSIGGTTI